MIAAPTAISKNNVEDTLRGVSGGITICGCGRDAGGGGITDAVGGERGLALSVSPSFAWVGG